jgi:hypothetical protein
MTAQKDIATEMSVLLPGPPASRRQRFGKTICSVFPQSASCPLRLLSDIFLAEKARKRCVVVTEQFSSVFSVRFFPWQG